MKQTAKRAEKRLGWRWPWASLAFLATASLLSAAQSLDLDPVSRTADQGSAREEYAIVRVGQHSSCQLRGASTDTYLKEGGDRFPGPWGWMDLCRVGGKPGDRNWALLYFDLGGLPQNASINKAVLRLSLVPWTNPQLASAKPGAWLLKLPEVPGWDPGAATFKQRREKKPWPGNTVIGAAGRLPVALGQVEMVERVRHGEKRKVPGAITYDLTGAVRAWVQRRVPNCGLLLDNRAGEGSFDFYSSRCLRPEWRPFLEIEVSPAVPNQTVSVTVKPALPPGDYWVGPMRAVHQRFKGKPGTLAQYGDSITTTMAFMAPHAWAEKIQPKNCPPEVRSELDLLERHANRKLWREWKGDEWGNTGMMMSDWLLKNVDQWQKKMNPETAVILFGTNDIGRILPPQYTENMAAALRRMMADGTVPMLTTVPPRAGADDLVYQYWLAGLTLAHGLKVPVIDYYGEILRRRPDDWNGSLPKFPRQKDEYQVPTLISGDGCHPSNPRPFENDFSEQALSSNGYNPRNYMTLRMYAQVIRKVFEPNQPPPPKKDE